MTKIIVLDGFACNPGDLSWDSLGAYGDLTVYDHTASADVIERIGDADIVCTNEVQLDDSVFRACPSLQYIGLLATGYDNIDCLAARNRQIVVSNVPGYGTESVAQHAFALILESCLHVGHHIEQVRSGRWNQNQNYFHEDFPLVELHQKTIGVVGYGRIGQAIARIALGFSMKVLVSSRHPENIDPAAVHAVSLDMLCQRADFICLTLPLTEGTRGMVDVNRISQMKPGVVLVNTARGALVHEDAIIEALQTKKISFYAADVVTVEPIPPGHPFLILENALITPHLAWATKESRYRLMDLAAQNLAMFLAGKPMNVVN